MKKFAALTLAVLMAFSFAACGGAPSSTLVSSDAVSTPVSSDAVSAAAPSQADQTDLSAITGPTLDAIKEKGTITMMTSTGFAPFEYLGADNKPAGVDIDLAQMIADELGVELEVLDMDFTLLVESLKSGKGDFIAAGMTASEERKQQIDFSNTYTKNGLLIVVPVGSNIKSAADLEGKSIAVQESTTAHIYVEEELGMTALAFKTPDVAANAVAQGKADCAVIDKLPAQAFVKANPDKITTLEELLTQEDMAMGIAKGKEDLVQFINAVLEKAMADGSLQASIDKHMEESAQG